MSDFEKPGLFYLGREFDFPNGKLTNEKVLYEASDLTTHAVCVGMTGSGKTGLCLSLIEEAALDGVPVIAIDPKGDLGNLLLAFPELRPSDFEPWIDPAAATQQGLTAAQLAEQAASAWRKGLAEWGQDGERIARFNAAVDKVIFTPGSNTGVPLTVLKSFHAPSKTVLDDTEAYNDLIQSTTQGLLALVGMQVDPTQSPEAILIARVLDHAWCSSRDLDLAGLIHDIQKPPFSTIGIVDVETFLPAKDRLALGMKINNLLASPSFASWLEGQSLDVESLFFTAERKPRLSILSISHLSDAERMFFVTILLNEVLSWVRSQPGTGSLRAILYMDEVFGYFPPSANPPSKRPMLTLLKQARAYGLGVVLATQNPVDLDYKGLSNAGTWFLGRLQTERDKLRVIEGLESVTSQTGASFNRSELDSMLSGLRSRVFLLNNVHDAGPKVMQTRWAMSYLRGPLTREQIRLLMKDRKSDSAPVATEQLTTTTASSEGGQSTPLVLSARIVQEFWPIDGRLAEDCRLEYRPALEGKGKLHFVEKGTGIDEWVETIVLQPIHGEMPDPVWKTALTFDRVPKHDESGDKSAGFAALPPPLAQEKNYRSWERDLKEWLYQTQRYVRWRYVPTDVISEQGETEEEFRQRLAPTALEAERQRIEDESNAEIKKTNEAIAKAESEAGRHKWWWLSGVGNFLGRAIEIFVTRLLGGRSRKQLVTVTSTRGMSRGHRQYTEAKESLDELKAKLAELEQQRQEQLTQLEARFKPDLLELDTIEIAPRKSDIDVDRVSLVWLPWQVDREGRARPLY